MSNLYRDTQKKRTLKDIVDPYLPRKKDVVPALEWMLPEASGERGRKGNLLDMAMAAPLLKAPLKFGSKVGSKILKRFGGGQGDFLGKFFGNPNIAKGGSSGGVRDFNRQLAEGVKGSDWTHIGKAKNPMGGVFQGSKRLDDLDVSVSNFMTKRSGRDVTAVKYSGKKGSLIQPVYKSSGFGVPEIKSGGKWLPFEGIKPGGVDVNVGGNLVGNNPGWFIKGFKQPGQHGVIQSTSIGKKVKEGLPIHQETNKLLQGYFGK